MVNCCVVIFGAHCVITVALELIVATKGHSWLLRVVAICRRVGFCSITGILYQLHEDSAENVHRDPIDDLVGS